MSDSQPSTPEADTENKLTLHDKASENGEPESPDSEDEKSAESISNPPFPKVVQEKDLEKGTVAESKVEAPVEANKPPQGQPSGPQVLPRKQFVIVFIGFFLSVLMASLDQTIVSTAIPAIVSDLGSLNDISWIFVAYLLTSTAFMPLYGKMGDIFGRTRVFIFALVFFMIGSLLCGVAVNMNMLIISRAIQGIGGGGLIALVMIIIADIVPIQERGKYQGIIGGTFALASVAGPLIGGVFVDHLTWRWLFFINLPIGVLCIAVITYALKVGPLKLSAIKRVDFLGVFLVVAAVVSAVLATNWGGNTYAWGSGEVAGLFAAAGVFFIGFVCCELFFAPEPVMQFRLLTIRNVAVSTFGSIFVGYPMFGSITYLPLYFQVVKDTSATQSGIQMMPMMFGVIIGSIGSGIFISKTGRYNFFPMIGLALATIGMYLLSLLDLSSGLGPQIGYLFIAGLGIGLCIQSFLISAQNSVEFKYIAVLTASINFYRTIGGVFGVAVFGAIFTAQISANSPHGSSGSFSVDAIKSLPEPIHHEVLVAFVNALSKTFLYAIPVVGAGFLVSLGMKHVPLRVMKPAGPPQSKDQKSVEPAPQEEEMSPMGAMEL